MHVLHYLIVSTTRKKSTALFVAQTLERTYHFGMGDRTFFTLRPRPLSKHLVKARFSHAREVWSLEPYEYKCK